MINFLKNAIKKYLLLGQKLIKLDLLYYFRGGFWLSLAQVASMFSAFFLSLAFANFLPKETYGTYKYVLSLLGIFAMFALPEIGTAITQATARGFGGTIVPALKAQVKWGSIGSILSLITAVYYYSQSNLELTLVFIIASAFLPIMDPLNQYMSILVGKGKFKILSYYNVSLKVVYACLFISAVYFFKSIVLIIVAYLLINTLSRLILFILTVNQTKILKEPVDKTAITYGKHLSLLKGIGVATGNLNGVLLFNLAGSQSLAMFSLATAPIEQIRAFIKLAEHLLLPRFSKEDWQLVSFGWFIKKIWAFCLALIGISALYILAAPYLFALFFPKYLDTIIYSQVYSVSIVITALNMVFTAFLSAKRQTKNIYFMSFIDTLSFFLITIPLIIFFGLWGLIISQLAIKVIIFCALLLLLFGQLPLRLFNEKK